MDGRVDRVPALKRVLIGVLAAGALIGGAALLTPSAPPPFPSLSLSASGGACQPGGSLVLGKSLSGALSAADVAKAAYAAGFRGRDLVVAVAVAHAESKWVATARGNNHDGSTDYGLFQINSIHAAILAGGNWADPNDNAVMAHQIWLGAHSSWSPWVTYWRGTYRQYLGLAGDAVAAMTSQVLKAPGCADTDVSAAGLTDPGTGRQGADGLTPRAEAVKAATLQRWGCSAKAMPCVPYIGGYAKRNIAGTGTVSDHATGNADDIMIGKDYKSVPVNRMGWEIAEFWRANAKAAGVKYIIFDAKIWSPGHEGWRPYSHPGGSYSDTLQHLDHVHVSVLS